MAIAEAKTAAFLCFIIGFSTERSHRVCQIHTRSTRSVHVACIVIRHEPLDIDLDHPVRPCEDAGHLARRTYSSTRLSLSALLITDTELKLIAAAAMIGLSRIPNAGYSTPAAIGTPTPL